MHEKDRSPCLLAHILHDVDVLVTPHGFQSMLLLFLPRPAIIFEVSECYLCKEETKLAQNRISCSVLGGPFD